MESAWLMVVSFKQPKQRQRATRSGLTKRVWSTYAYATGGERGIPIAVSLYRPFNRKDTKTTFRLNLDYDMNDNVMFYASATSGHRAGGYNLVFFSKTPTYDPEELIAYELGYKTQWMDNSLQLNGSFYFYDYENIHTVATEVNEFWYINVRAASSWS